MPSDMEGLDFDGLDINDPDGIYCESVDWKPAAKVLEWVKSADTDGARLLRRPKHDNAVMTLKLRVSEQATMDAAIDFIQVLVDKLQHAERLSAGGRSRGLELNVVPANSTYSGTVYVLTGEIENLPRDWQDSGWFVNNPTFTVRVDCHPFIYGEEIVYPSSPSTDSTPLHTLEVPAVGGDVDAEAVLIFTDMASQNRDLVRWWLENAGYDPATDLLIDSDVMVTTGMAGVQFDDPANGAYDPGGSGNDCILATLATTPVAVCSTPEIANIGVFDSLVRVFAGSVGVKIRVSYRVGRGQWSTLPWVMPAASGKWCEVDLGRVTLPEAVAGSQGAVLRFEAVSDTPGDAIVVDYALLGPTADVGGGTARQPLLFPTPSVFSARDEFGHTAGGLVGKTPPAGSPWTGAGDADDFAINTGTATARRTAVSDSAGVQNGRLDVATAVMGGQAVRVDVKPSVLNGRLGATLRYTNISNFLCVYWDAGTDTLAAEKRVAGSNSPVGGAYTVPTHLSIRGLSAGLTLEAWVIRGLLAVWLWERGTTKPANPALLTGKDSDLSDTGALGTGKAGLFDHHTSAFATDRDFDNYLAWEIPPVAACFSGQSIEFRGHGDDACLREDSTGVYYGVPDRYRGARFALPPGTSRIAAIGRRDDITESPSENVTDGGQLQVAYRERRLVLPG
jgi:hypothetical protein